MKERNIGTLPVNGNNLCCNFVNTVYAWSGKNLHEYLGKYEDFINWCRKLNVGDEVLLKPLLVKAKQFPRKADTALKEIKNMRLLLYNFISAIAAKDNEAIRTLLPQVNKFLDKAAAHTTVQFSDNNFTLTLIADSGDLLSPVWIVLQSLNELLLTEDMERIKECPRCGWVFVDRTKNATRRWCAPEECGSADKMQRYNAKKNKA
jgi:predicted RNA-binding Zn ribbon-like protein